jgi:hypothetical protein
MLLAMDFRRQGRVCAEDCEDPQLASRLKSMAADLLAKAEDFEDLRAVGFDDSKKLDAA